MRFHWTIEVFGYCLRDSRGYAWSTVVRASKEEGGGFYGSALLSNDRQVSGPYKGRQEAADWVTGRLVDSGTLPADSEFGLIPDTAKSLRRAA